MSRRNWWVLLAMIPVGMIAGLVLARVHLYLVPRVYESEVILQMKQHSNSGIHYMTGTEIDLFLSRNSLLTVSDKLDLEKSWGADEEAVLARLRDAVQVMVIKGTDLKRVKVTSTDPVEARDIARELVKTYMERRTKMERESNDRMVTELKRAVQEQEDKVEQARKELENIMKIKGNTVPANDAEVVESKRKFDLESDFFELMKLKLRSEEIDSSMIETVNVVIDEPVLPNKPVGLSERAIMLNWMLGGAVFSPLIALAIMAILNRRRRPEMG